MKIINFFKKQPKKIRRVFFDLPKEEQGEIIREAAKGANEDQKKLVDDYYRMYSKNRS